MKPDDVLEGLENLRAEAGRLAEEAAANGKPAPLLSAEILLTAHRATRRLTKLRVEVQKGGRRDSK
jgi:hypothetical protein